MHKFKLIGALLLCVVGASAPAKSFQECLAEAGETTGAERKALMTACLSEGQPAESPKKKGPLEQSDVGAKYHILSCGISFKTAQLGGDADYRQCIKEGKVNIKNGYEAVLKRVKKPAARAALKEYYIASITSLQGIEPQSDERKMNYEKRQGDNLNKLDEMWIRFETEN